MCLKSDTPCDYGECPYNAMYNRDCEYWCGADEPYDYPEYEEVEYVEVDCGGW